MYICCLNAMQAANSENTNVVQCMECAEERREKSQQVPSSWVRPGVFLPSYLHIFAHFREGAASSTAPLPCVSQAQLLLITTTSYRLDTYNVHDRFLYFKMCCINVICLLVSQRRNYTRNITTCNMPFICTYCTL
jgi:hypothetical protein